MIYYPSHTMRQRAARGRRADYYPLIELMRRGCAVRRVRACVLQRIDTAYRYELHYFAERQRARPESVGLFTFSRASVGPYGTV